MSQSLETLLTTDFFRNEVRSGKGVSVGHLDSGLTIDHPYLQSVTYQYRSFDRNGNLRPGTGLPDKTGHGSHTAGLVAQLAPEVSLHSAGVIEGGYVVWRILKGLDWLIDQSVSIALLAIGLKIRTPVFVQAIAALRRHGILPIASIGNGGAGEAFSPGWYPDVLSVGAVDADGRIPPFSGSLNRGQACLKPDVVALGVNIESAHPAGAIARRSGTSMSSAIVAGIAVLLRETMPSASLADIEWSLKASCRPVAEWQAHRVRYGIVDPSAALRYLQERPPACNNRSKHECSETLSEQYRDPRILRKLANGQDRNCMGVVFTTQKESCRAVVERVMTDQASTLSEDYLKHSNTAYVVGNHAFVRYLLSDPGVSAVMLPDVDLT